MTLKLPTVPDPAVQRVIDLIAQQFPIQGSNLGAPAGAAVTSLPTTNLFAGRQIAYKAAEGVLWNLLYTKESAEYPWNFIGGPPLVNRVVGAGERNNAAYGDCTAGVTTVPTVTTPLKGDYIVEHGCQVQLSGGASSNFLASIEIGASAAVDEDSAKTIGIDQFEGGTVRSEPMEKTLAVSTALKQKYKGFTETRTWVIEKRFVSILPKRVG